MCAITGFIGHHKSISTLKTMLDTMVHRGQDDQGLYFDPSTGVHIGHNRLSIQDLSSLGHQPFISDCGDYIISFNGEVYNFNSLRHKLESMGYCFTSQTDTEVILYAFKEWGIDCIKKWIGMFALALLDKKQKKLYLIRDRAGVKPLYYYTKGELFLFASEIKALIIHPHFKKREDPSVLPYYFQFGYIPAPYSIFQNCYKLPAGHYLEFDLQKSIYQITKYWDVNNFYLMDKWNKSEETILKELEDMLTESVNLRMISDAPVGVFLSGGYDSSLVTALLTKISRQNRIRTFTIGFDNPLFNEAEQARSVAAYLGTEHTEYIMKERDMLNLVESLPTYFDEPFGDSSALPTMLVSKMARENVTVALSADGGDEVFCGYSKYFFLNHQLNYHPIVRLIIDNSIRFVSPTVIKKINDILPRQFRQTNIQDKFEKFKRAISSKSQAESFFQASSYVAPEIVSSFLKVSMNDKLLGYWGNIPGIGFLDQMMAIDYKLFMTDDVLTKVDRSTMSVSLEGREPLLDHRIIEYMARIPIELKYKNRQGKYLLRKILHQYLPPRIADKPKSGFQIPLSDWLRGDLRPWIEKYIFNKNWDEEIFDYAGISRLTHNFLNGKGEPTSIWFLLMYRMWKEKWL